jgi:SAM-dependent methyltransferase
MTEDTRGSRARYGERLAAGTLESPAAERNKEPILGVLREGLPARGLVLEIASGTGQHAAHFARALPSLDWQPTDPDAGLLEAIAARVDAAGLPNLRKPLPLDVHAPTWPVASADAIVCINMIHIAPPSATEALLAGAERVLCGDGPLVLYGPFRRGGEHTAPSNAAFDADLRRRNAEWGVRDLETVAALAERHGLTLERLVPMPANNFTVVFRKR